jgi:phosphatidate cytidylyltransferase
VLRQRSISATLIVIGTLIAIAAGGWVFLVGALVTTLAALNEFMTMVSKAGYAPARVLGFVLVVVFMLVAQVGAPGRLMSEAVLLAVIGPLLTVMLRRSLAGTMQDWALSVAGILYVGWLAAHAVMLRAMAQSPDPVAFLVTDFVNVPTTGQVPLGLRWMLAAVLTTWATDTAAFFVGRAWGRRPLAPLLSPKKSQEGALGGLVAATLTFTVCALVLQLPPGPVVAVVFGACLGTLAQIGDLAESLIKRQTGFKDASAAIPGHGGVLDRIDSLLFTIPTTYYFATFYG